MYAIRSYYEAWGVSIKGDARHRAGIYRLLYTILIILTRRFDDFGDFRVIHLKNIGTEFNAGSTTDTGILVN